MQKLSRNDYAATLLWVCETRHESGVTRLLLEMESEGVRRGCDCETKRKTQEIPGHRRGLVDVNVLRALQ